MPTWTQAHTHTHTREREREAYLHTCTHARAYILTYINTYTHPQLQLATFLWLDMHTQQRTLIINTSVQDSGTPTLTLDTRFVGSFCCRPWPMTPAWKTLAWVRGSGSDSPRRRFSLSRLAPAWPAPPLPGVCGAVALPPNSGAFSWGGGNIITLTLLLPSSSQGVTSPGPSNLGGLRGERSTGDKISWTRVCLFPLYNFTLLLLLLSYVSTRLPCTISHQFYIHYLHSWKPDSTHLEDSQSPTWPSCFHWSAHGSNALEVTSYLP